MGGIIHNPSNGGHHFSSLYQVLGEDEGTGGLNHQPQILIRNQDFPFGDDGSTSQQPSLSTAAVISSGVAIGGVGTTSAMLFNDEEDEGFNQQHESGGNNQIRIERGAAMMRQLDGGIALGSGGGQPEEGEEDE
jgi:hypothetical protein